MRRLSVFIAGFVFLASLGLSAEEGNTYRYSYARLSFVKGDVFIERAGDMGYEEGVVNLPVVEGDKLGTREGRAEIHFGRKNYLRIDGHSQLDFVGLPKEGNDEIKLHLLAGSIFLRVSYVDEDMSFGIHTPDASFYIVKEGLYRFNVRENRETELMVYEGAVEAAGEEGSLLVESEQKLTVTSGYFSSDPVDFYARLDDGFSEWNKARDDLLLRPAETSYLPTELYEYEDELADNGRWVYERPYGYVWVPTVVHDVWRPYHYGRWCWYPFIGWTWVSYDPWGWCVTHYGRWHWRWGLGWYWIPTRVWGSAWVHWCWGSHYIGWCPLSYYGHPVVVVNNYFYGRHYGRDYPAHSRALTMVRKDQLQARHISRAALSRDSLRRIGKVSLSDGQPTIRPRVNSASLRNSTAARVLSRNNLRKVERSYVPTSRVSASRLRSTGSLNSSRTLIRRSSSGERRSMSENPRRITGERSVSQNSIRARSPSLRRSGTPASSSSQVAKRSPSESKIRIYPSRKSNVSRSSAASSAGRTRAVSSRESQSRVGRSTSREYPSRLKVERESRRSQSSGTYPSRSSTLRRSSASRTAVPPARSRLSSSSSSRSSSQLSRSRSSSANIGRSRSSGSRSAVRRSSSSVSSRSRATSSRRSSASSSRSRISSSRSGSSSSSRAARSSSRSSSSRSSSRGRSVRRK